MAQTSGSVVRGCSYQPGESLHLRDSRQRRGLSLEEIADRTKISIRFLRAIEAEEFEKLPGGIFTTSYLRQYAEVVGLEESRLLMYYESKSSPPESDAGQSRQETSESLLLRFWSAAAGR